jgi:hypothetical protein
MSSLELFSLVAIHRRSISIELSNLRKRLVAANESHCNCNSMISFAMDQEFRDHAATCPAHYVIVCIISSDRRPFYTNNFPH